jgi:hypothetical protein
VSLGDLKLIAELIIVPAVSAIGALAALAAIGVWFQSRKTPRGTIALITAFAAVGVTTGFAAGNSREPAVSAMLPAMLALTSGLLGYLFSKDSLADWRPVIPFCVTVVAIGGLLGLGFGATARRKGEATEQEYARWLLKYEHVDLENKKAEYLAILEKDKAQYAATLEKDKAAYLAQLAAARKSP